MTLEVGSVLTAAARLSVANVPREVFSINPLQAAIMAAQIEAGPIEIALRDIGGVDLAVAQYARTQNVSRDAARTRAGRQHPVRPAMTLAIGQPGRHGDRGRARALRRSPARHADDQAHARAARCR